MRPLIAAIVVCLVAAACSSHSTTTFDARLDGAGSGVACTGAIYDPCTSPAQCMSANCHLYMNAGIQVCTQTCTAGMNSTCPVDSTGANGFCNNMGNCKPAKANSCTR